MIPTARETVRLAYSQKGYKAPGPGKKNKYAAWFDSKMPGFFNYRKNGVNVDWCAIFVCFCVAYLAKNLSDACKVMCTPKKSCAAGVKWLYRYFNQHGRITKTAGYGYVIFLNDYKHVGIVHKVEDGKVHYTAGNEGGSHGEVKTHTISALSKKICCYGRPKYK